MSQSQVPTCLEWVCCFQARHVSKLRNYPATDQHDKVRVRQVRARPAAAEVRGRGGLLQSEAVVREALAWEEGTGTGTDLCCEPFAYMSNAQAASHACVKGKNLVDDEGGELQKCGLL